MTSRTRALLGAAAGAVLVLFLHPATRPGMLAAFRPLPPAGLNGLLTRPELPVPNDLDTGAGYLHAGAERLRSGPPLAADERRTLIALAVQGETHEPDNPFWPLAQFVFRNGQGTEARKAWRRASRCKRYYDHQRALLIEDRERIAGRVGDVQAWIYAAVAPQRSSALVEKVREIGLRTGRNLSSSSDRLDFAFETIRNGALIRDGSERLDLGFLGIDMIEQATYPPDLFMPGKRSKIMRLWVAKAEFTQRLGKRGRTSDVKFCYTQFRTNDGWQAFRDVQEPEDRFRTLAIAASFAGAVPGALLLASLAGGLVWLFSRRVATVRSDRFRGPGLAASSFVLLLAGIGLGYPIVGIAAGACALVPGLSPDKPRRYPGEPLGPLHVLIVGLLIAALGGTVVLAAIARSLPGQILPDQGYWGAWLGDARRWAAIGVVVLGASALAPPAWALVRRFPTPGVAARTYRDFGRSLASIGIVLAIVSSPLSLALDRWLGNSLAEIALNEQNAYGPSDGGTR